MKITVTGYELGRAPGGYTRIHLTEDDRGTKRFVREEATDTLELGVGKASEITRRKLLVLLRSIVATAKQHKARKIALQLSFDPKVFTKLGALTPEEIGYLAAQNFEMANYEHNVFKTAPKGGFEQVEEILLSGKSSKSLEAAVKRGQEVGRAVNLTRALANTPGGDMTPRTLAAAAKRAAKELPAGRQASKITVTTLGVKEMRKLGMGALLGVAKGSDEEPTFTIMQYKGAAGAPIVLAGKGITFDSGGLNLKPSNSIYEMHMDMSGAAAVIHTVALAAKLGVKKHVIGLIPSAENMPSGAAYRPGDVLKSLSGKTIEVLNTDAEGRLILADALTYAKKFKPSVVLDVATLTGAAMSALGLHANALLTRDDKLAEQLLAHAETSGDYLWRLPLWDEYEDMVKGTFADVTNSSNSPGGRYGGAIEGGMFLWQFAKELDCPWAHIDIAPRMTSVPGEELAKGAAGTPVRMLLSFIESWKA